MSTFTHYRRGNNSGKYEVGYEERYSCESCGEGFMEGAYNNLYCDNCVIEQGILD